MAATVRRFFAGREAKDDNAQSEVATDAFSLLFQQAKGRRQNFNSTSKPTASLDENNDAFNKRLRRRGMLHHAAMHFLS